LLPDLRRELQNGTTRQENLLQNIHTKTANLKEFRKHFMMMVLSKPMKLTLIISGMANTRNFTRTEKSKQKVFL